MWLQTGWQMQRKYIERKCSNSTESTALKPRVFRNTYCFKWLHTCQKVVWSATNCSNVPTLALFWRVPPPLRCSTCLEKLCSEYSKLLSSEQHNISAGQSLVVGFDTEAAFCVYMWVFFGDWSLVSLWKNECCIQQRLLLCWHFI